MPQPRHHWKCLDCFGEDQWTGRASSPSFGQNFVNSRTLFGKDWLLVPIHGICREKRVEGMENWKSPRIKVRRSEWEGLVEVVKSGCAAGRLLLAWYQERIPGAGVQHPVPLEYETWETHRAHRETPEPKDSLLTCGGKSWASPCTQTPCEEKKG